MANIFKPAEVRKPSLKELLPLETRRIDEDGSRII
jgi:hypothetical protein